MYMLLSKRKPMKRAVYFTPATPNILYTHTPRLYMCIIEEVYDRMYKVYVGLKLSTKLHCVPCVYERSPKSEKAK